jgi:Transposase DDE domain
MSIDINVKKIILDIVKIKCNHRGRKSSQSDEHFLEIFIDLLKDYTKWKCIDKEVYKKSKYTHDHYRKKFISWVNNGVFDAALQIILKLNKHYLSDESKINCFIDATNIRNVNGSYKRNIDMNNKTLLGRLYADKWKRNLKVTILITDKNHLLDVKVSSGQSHDITVIPHIAKELFATCNSNKRHRITVCGDKGYASKANEKLFEKNGMYYVTPEKKYKNKKTKPKQQPIEKDRHKVENYFCHLKKFTRIKFLYDKMVSVYVGFLKLAILVKSNTG